MRQRGDYIPTGAKVEPDLVIVIFTEHGKPNGLSETPVQSNPIARKDQLPSG